MRKSFSVAMVVLGAAMAVRPVHAGIGIFDADHVFGSEARLGGSIKAEMTARRSLPVYAKTISCAASKDANVDALKFYTRLDGVGPLAALSTKGLSLSEGPVRKDETARQLDDYFAATVTPTLYHYDVWSCDSWDYSFTFDAPSLVQKDYETSRPIKGHLREEVRGGLEWEGDLDCVANW